MTNREAAAELQAIAESVTEEAKSFDSRAFGGPTVSRSIATLSDAIQRLAAVTGGLLPEQGRAADCPLCEGSGVVVSDGEPLRYLLWAHRLGKWWGPEAVGYFDLMANAGRYSEADAIRYVIKSAMSGDPRKATVMVVAPEARS